MHDFKSLIPSRLSHFLDSDYERPYKKWNNYFILFLFLEAGYREECDSKLNLTTTFQKNYITYLSSFTQVEHLLQYQYA